MSLVSASARSRRRRCVSCATPPAARSLGDFLNQEERIMLLNFDEMTPVPMEHFKGGVGMPQARP